MKCKVCGNESGKYPLCRACNEKKNSGLIIKCPICNQWHYKDKSCVESNDSSDDHCNDQPSNDNENRYEYLYKLKNMLISKTEADYFEAIKSVLPDEYFVFPQINLAAIIERTDNFPFRNELFRNVDFLITDKLYTPKIIIEINDQTHMQADRKERDKKVVEICEEAGIPIINLWTSYGISNDYIHKRIEETLASLPIERKCHPKTTPPVKKENNSVPNKENKPSGCYIATCVYKSYDCPQVWTLRRYRDNYLKQTLLGRLFIKFYYAVSPSMVKLFGNFKWFHKLFLFILNKKVSDLNSKGVDSSPYYGD